MLRSSLSRFAVLLLAVTAGSHGRFVAADADHGSCSATDASKRDPAALISSFTEISEALARETDRVFDPAIVRHSQTFKTLTETNDLALWNEMLRQQADLTLPIVGLMCIEQKRPALAFDAAARCVMLHPRPGSSPMGYAVEILGKGSKDQNSADRIARLIESGVGSDDAIVVLVLALTRDDLIACFGALDNDRCAASRLAWVVSQVGSSPLDDLDEKIKSKYRTCLDSLATTPGTARCVYLSLIDEKAQNVKACLRLAILDPDVDQLSLIPVLRRFAKTYRTDLGDWLKGATEKRQAFVRKYISP
jgi:hypothetical protein